MATDILWDQSVLCAAPMRSPEELLLEQAAAVSQMTEGHLHATVRRVRFRRSDGDEMKLTLYLGAKTRPDFVYEVLSISHAYGLPYPCSVLADETTDSYGTPEQATSEEGLKGLIALVLKSPRVNAAISSLRVQFNTTGTDGLTSEVEEVDLRESGQGRAVDGDVPF